MKLNQIKAAARVPSARFLAQVRMAITARNLPVQLADLVADGLDDPKRIDLAASGLAKLMAVRTTAAEMLPDDEIETLANAVVRKVNDLTERDATAADAEKNVTAATMAALQMRLATYEYPTRTVPNPYQSGGRASVGQSWDHGEGLVSRMTDGLLARVDRGHRPTIGAEFVEMSLPQMADYYLRATGKGTARMFGGRGAQIEAALHTTSDFPAILSGVVNRQLLVAYNAAASGIMGSSKEITARDFRDIHAVRLSSGPDLEKVLEGGEFSEGTFSDSGEKFALATFGRIFSISRQALVNDDLGALSSVPGQMGQAAGRTVGNNFASLLKANGGLGPKMADAKTLFHADHGNLAAAASALSIASLTEARTKMRRQTGLAGEIISVTPVTLLVPPELETLAEQLVTEITPRSVTDVNPFGGRLQVAVDAYLTSKTGWYLTGAPGNPDTLQHAYLDQATGPQVFQEVGFEVDGVRWKVRLDFGCGFVDTRGWFYNPGA